MMNGRILGGGSGAGIAREPDEMAGLSFAAYRLKISVRLLHSNLRETGKSDYVKCVCRKVTTTSI
jgi:hypothetical protein